MSDRNQDLDIQSFEIDMLREELRLWKDRYATFHAIIQSHGLECRLNSGETRIFRRWLSECTKENTH